MFVNYINLKINQFFAKENDLKKILYIVTRPKTF